MDESYLLTYPGLTYGKGGVFMNNTRCDTIWWIDRNTLEVRPRMVDRSDYGSRKNIMAIPSFETDKYVFFNIIYQRADWVDGPGRVATNQPWPEDRVFAFDKEREKIFRIPLTESLFKPADEVNAYGIDPKWSWAADECMLTCWQTTLNGDYGIAMFQAYELLDRMDTLSPELKKIAATLKEDDNPVLMLIKFK
jgi:hypothetical protein